MRCVCDAPTRSRSRSRMRARTRTHMHSARAHSCTRRPTHTLLRTHVWTEGYAAIAIALIASDDCFGVNGTITKATSTVNCQMAIWMEPTVDRMTHANASKRCASTRRPRRTRTDCMYARLLNGGCIAHLQHERDERVDECADPELCAAPLDDEVRQVLIIDNSSGGHSE